MKRITDHHVKCDKNRDGHDGFCSVTTDEKTEFLIPERYQTAIDAAKGTANISAVDETPTS